MPEFVLNRKHNLVGGGHNVQFLKGQPTYVPPELVKAAIAAGAECLDGPVDVLGPEETPEPLLSAVDKENLFNAAFAKLTARNERDDFGGDGKPSMDALKKLLNFSFIRKERDAAFNKYRADLAAEQEQAE